MGEACSPLVFCFILVYFRLSIVGSHKLFMEGPAMAASAFCFDSQQQQLARHPDEGFQLGETDSSSNNHADSEVVTLLVRHLPEAIPHDTFSRLFSHYGASSVRPCAGGRLRNCAFVDFKNEVLASQAQSQLNRLRFLGKVLLVERVGMATSNKKQKTDGQLVRKSTSGPAALSIDSPVIGNHTKGVAVSAAVPIGEPIASKIGVDYPFPLQLEYAYPPPDGNILTNIVNALIAVPRFYTQVLHLMNKMNLPAPFRAALPTPPLPPSAPAPPPPPPPPPAIAVKPHLADLSSDESELESSDEGDPEERRYPGGIPKKVLHGHKRAKREAIVGPAIDKAVLHEAVGLKPAILVPKEFPTIKKKTPVLQIKIAPKPVQNEVMHDENTVEEVTEPAVVGLEVKPYATPQEIETAKLPPEEILSLPMFKNYTAGNPTTVLYIKNLAKDVVVDDFYFIFGSLFESVEAAKSGIIVKLMQEGRMRGQAFLTFPSIELSQHALKLVNGYLFKGKPMIIQYGRNPASASKAN